MNSNAGKFSRLLSLRFPLILGGALALLALSLSVSAQDKVAPYSDHQVKAVFVYHFASFVKWPDSAFSTADSAFTVCTNNSDDLSKMLESALNGETISGRKVSVITEVSKKLLSRCQIIYLAKGFDPHLLEEIQQLDTYLLTVSDDKAFIDRGGMIKLVQRKGRVHPVINKSRLEKAHLKASAKLLQLATIVDK